MSITSILPSMFRSCSLACTSTAAREPAMSAFTLSNVDHTFSAPGRAPSNTISMSYLNRTEGCATNVVVFTHMFPVVSAITNATIRDRTATARCMGRRERKVSGQTEGRAVRERRRATGAREDRGCAPLSWCQLRFKRASGTHRRRAACTARQARPAGRSAAWRWAPRTPAPSRTGGVTSAARLGCARRAEDWRTFLNVLNGLKKFRLDPRWFASIDFSSQA